MHAIALILTWLLIACLVVASLLPLLPVGAWTIRLCDFPRAQITLATIAMALILLVIGFRSGWSAQIVAMLLTCIVVGLWQGAHVLKYSPIWSKEIADATSRDPADCTVAVVNLQYENDEKQAVLKQLRSLDLDMLLLIEVDQRWHDALKPLEDDYEYREGIVREKGLGLVLLSKLPLSSTSVEHLVSEKRASIFADVEVSSGRKMRFVGLHPTPPGLPDHSQGDRYDSRIRDAELMLVAKRVEEDPDRAWVVTGDFNDVAWSHTTRMFQRISGLLDPRVGRGLYNTYHAERIWMRVPIDQIFLSPGSTIHDLDRFHPAGSDHFAIITSFSVPVRPPGRSAHAEPEPSAEDLEEAQELIEEGSEDASDRDNDSAGRAETAPPKRVDSGE